MFNYPCHALPFFYIFLRSDATCNTDPPSMVSGGLINTFVSVAMRGYSHFSENEREPIKLLKKEFDRFP